jgi:chromosome segregation ATPase
MACHGKLVLVVLDNFKSFRNRTEIGISDGFNCITGENGAGKSNLIDAVSFALGESVPNLRVKNVTELAFNPNSKIEVELQFDYQESNLKGKKSRTRVGSTIVDSVRYYLINGVRFPKHRFDETTNELGLSVGGQAVWRITQCEIDKKVALSPAELYDAICTVSGTKQFNQRREDAQKQIIACKRTLLLVKVQEKKVASFIFIFVAFFSVTSYSSGLDRRTCFGS